MINEYDIKTAVRPNVWTKRGKSESALSSMWLKDKMCCWRHLWLKLTQ